MRGATNSGRSSLRARAEAAFRAESPWWDRVTLSGRVERSVVLLFASLLILASVLAIVSFAVDRGRDTSGYADGYNCTIDNIRNGYDGKNASRVCRQEVASAHRDFSDEQVAAFERGTEDAIVCDHTECTRR